MVTIFGGHFPALPWLEYVSGRRRRDGLSICFVQRASPRVLYSTCSISFFLLEIRASQSYLNVSV
jgi:hypothetical protein